MSDRMRSPLGHVYGLGSAREGSHDWWLMRLTSVALVGLSLWWVVSIVLHAGTGYANFVNWIADPVSAILMILTIVATFYHLALGVQVVIEDYVHHEWTKVGALIGVKFACIALAALGIFSVLRIAILN